MDQQGDIGNAKPGDAQLREVFWPDERVGSKVREIVIGLVLTGAGVLLLWFVFHDWASLQGKKEQLALPVLGLLLTGGGLWLFTLNVKEGLYRAMFRVDEKNLYREERWGALSRTKVWPKERICNISREWRRTTYEMTVVRKDGEPVKRRAIDWYEVILTLDDGTWVRLTKPCREEVSIRLYDEIHALLGKDETNWWNWGKAPGTTAVTVEAMPGRVEVTFQPVPAWKFESSYWLRREFMSPPTVIVTVLVIGSLAVKLTRPIFASHLFQLVAILVLFVGGAFVLVWIGMVLVRTARKRAQTVTVITCDKDSLAIKSSCNGETHSQEFLIGEIALIRRERFDDPSLRRAPLTVQLITHEAIAKAAENAPILICWKCGYDLRHEPETCPECGATPGEREPMELAPIAIIKCRTPLEASWLESRLVRWLQAHDDGMNELLQE